MLKCFLMKIGIFGGTFDPPHLGHTIAAHQIINKLALDSLWLMPVATHAFGKNLSSEVHRMQMTKLISKGKIKADNTEIVLGGVSSSYKTMKFLRKKFPKDNLYFCMGSDLLYDFHKWDNWQSLVAENKIVVFPRGSYQPDLKTEIKNAFGNMFHRITLIEGKDIVTTNISSSIIREKIKSGLNANYLLNKKVINYIYKNNLYQI